MSKYIGKFILVSIVLVLLGSGEIKAETGSIGYIGPTTKESSQGDTSRNSSMGYIGATAQSSSSDTSNSSTTSTKSTSAKAAAAVSSSAVSAASSITTAANSSGVTTNVQSASVQVEPYSGSAGLSIPIAVPPGRAGIQPNLALTYSSTNRQLGNAGVGWTLDLGSIQISTKKGVPKYDGTDIFTMEQDGATQDLVADPNTPGLYHMEVEGAFANIQFFTMYWVITDKKGIKYYYGNYGATSECIQNDPANLTHIFRWALSRVEDLNGNYMTISYLNDNGQIYPQTISYTGNDTASLNLSTYAQVSINYVPASSPSISYISKFLVKTAQRINQINVSVGPNIQSTYTFTYHQSANTQRDLLQSVQQTGADGSSTLPPVTFTYNEALPQWQLASGWTIPSNLTLNYSYNGQSVDSGVRIMDLNGDGYPDFVRSFFTSGVSTSNQSYTYLNSKNSGWVLNNGWALNPNTVPFTYIVNMGSPLLYMGALISDINGDGLADIVGSNEIVNSSGQIICADSGYFGTNSNGSFTQDTNWQIPSGVSFYKDTTNGTCIYNCPQTSNGVVLADVTGNGFSDLVQSIGNTQGVYINQYPQGSKSFVQNTSFAFPSSTYTDLTQGAQLVDLTGDGLADIVYLKGGVLKVFLNTGSGWTETGDFENIQGLGDFTNLSTQVVDVNGDGLPDLVITSNGNRANATILLNTGSGWSQYQGNMGDFDFFDYGTQFLDANADGMQGYLTYEAGGSPELYLNANKPVDLLIGVNNGIGASTSIQYNSDFHYQNTYMPYFIPVVQSTTTTVGSQSYTTTYNYAGGLWDKTYREFDGFQTVTVTDPYGNYVTSTFLQDHWLKGHPSEQDTYDSNGNLYSKSVNTWQTQTIATNTTSNQISKFLYVSRTDNYLYDGNSSAVPKRTAQEFTYGENPQYGDVTQTINDGQVDPTAGTSIDPNRTVTNVTYVNNTSNWLLGLPAQSITQDTNGNTISKTSFYYDGDTTGSATPVLGQLTSKINWLGSTTQADPKTKYTYDAYGNLQTTTDPNGNITTITYDNTVHMFPEQTKNALKQIDTMTYYGIDAAPLNNGQGLQGLWGQACSKTDANNQTAYTTYDVFGRPSTSISPLDTVALPTEQKTYNIQPTYIAVTDTARVTNGSSATISTVSYYDGLGRLIETKSLGPTAGQYIASGQTVYDNRGLPTIKYLPYFTSNDLNTMDAIPTSGPYSQVTYDPMGRVITKTNPDGTYSSISYNQWTTTTTDENGHMRQSFVDAFGRLIQKEEYTGADGRSSNYPAASYTLYATTNYSYDPKGDLISVMDAKNNVTTITYDNLGRKIAMNDPDMGIWQYGYDGNGNLIWQQDAKGQVISFQYDALNRLKNKNDAIRGPIVNLPNLTPHPSTFNVNYNFDDRSQDFGVGRLGSAGYNNGTAGFIYDQMGREVDSNKTVGTVSYDVSREYDALNRLQQIEYPDQAKVEYLYNQAGQVTTVEDSNTPISPISNYGDAPVQPTTTMPPTTTLPPDEIQENNTYVSNVSYNANGQITQIQYGNGVTTAYTYDPLSFRLTRIYTSNAKAQVVQDLNYTYDSLGQVLTILDKVTGSPQIFAYDDLNRLIVAVGPPNYLYKNYAYDAIGNITLKDGLTYNYGELNSQINSSGTAIGKAGPHAVTSLSDGSIFKYDANGNMVSMQKGSNLTQYVYDSQNRLQTVKVGGLIVATYAYDGDGGRTQKTVYRRDLALYNDSVDTLLFGNSNGTPLPATAQNPTVDTTYYVGNVYESEGTRHTKFIYLGDTKVAAVEGNGSVYYYHTDHLGSTNTLTDQTGLVREMTEYDPFGQVVAHEKYGNDFATAWYYFTGKPLDDETGLIFLGARYYNPVLGRFITPDTTVQAPSNPQTLNRYTYCNNNPVNLIDPTGHSWWKKFWHSVEKVFGDIVGAIAGVVAGVLTGNFMVGFQVFNGVSSLINAGISGNWGGFAGSLAGGLIGGAIGGAIGGSMVASWGVPMAEATFGQGFAVGAVEMGLSGFGAGFGGAIGSGASIGRAFIAGAIAGGIGAIAGGIMEGSYVTGMQNLMHGEDENEWNGHALQGQFNRMMQSLSADMQMVKNGIYPDMTDNTNMMTDFWKQLSQYQLKDGGVSVTWFGETFNETAAGGFSMSRDWMTYFGAGYTFELSDATVGSTTLYYAGLSKYLSIGANGTGNAQLSIGLGIGWPIGVSTQDYSDR